MPVGSVAQIHLAGATIPENGLVIDDHACPVTDDVWRGYEQAIKRFGAIPTLVEWDSNLPDWSVLAAIWREDAGEFSAQGIAIYRRNLLANAQRALTLSFPTIFELLDSNVSEQLVADFLRFSPPSQGDWGQWGAVFSAFISQHELSDDYAYLADCAALDWAVHQALHGTDTTLDSASLQQLADVEPAQLTVVINPNVVIMTSEYPLVDIFDAHHHTDEAMRNDALHRAKAQFSDECMPCTAMVFRPEYQPRVCMIPESEAMFMQILIANKSLGEALDSMSDFPDFSFEQWLVKAIENNLIVRLATRS